MKAIIAIILAVLFWVLVGHFFSSFSISITAFFLPILFALVAFTIGKETNKYIYIAVCFILVLIHDYLFRLYGGGIRDDAGRGICEIVFYGTLITSTIALLIIKILESSKRSKLKSASKLNGIKILFDIIFVLGLSAVTLLFFRKFNISI
jgi:hypothetical protein